MISRDARREHGIYLGEMVWALIFAALNKVAYLYPRGLSGRLCPSVF